MENNPNPNWERQALEHLLLENLKETRKARRWKAVLRVLTLLVIIGALLSIFDFHLPGKGMLSPPLSDEKYAHGLDLRDTLRVKNAYLTDGVVSTKRYRQKPGKHDTIPASHASCAGRFGGRHW